MPHDPGPARVRLKAQLLKSRPDLGDRQRRALGNLLGPALKQAGNAALVGQTERQEHMACGLAEDLIVGVVKHHGEHSTIDARTGRHLRPPIRAWPRSPPASSQPSRKWTCRGASRSAEYS